MNPLTDAPIRWPAEAIWEAVAPTLPGFTVEVLPTVDSTNTELMRRFRAAGPAGAEPVLLVAEQQSAGRGRLGRAWHSRAGDSLTFSLGLPLPPVPLSGLSLAIGVSIAESLQPAAPRDGEAGIRLKWPNDLWLTDAQGERKLAGILVETANLGEQRYVVIGVGINIRALALEPSTAPDPVAALAPAPLQALLPDMQVAQALQRVAAPLVQAVQAFALFGFAPFQARFAARDVLAGRAVRLSDGTEGTAHGVGENGALLVHTAAGMQEITSSEVSVRPIAGRGTATC
jgi:BirA family biotin operon repressor/biotin-[acetyl-CoA-carboxylase] ligase